MRARLMRAWWRVLVAPALVVAGLAGCASDPPRIGHLVVAGGPPGDVYAALAAGLADAARERWSIEATALTTGGAKENLQLVADGQVDAGFATIDTAQQATHGEAPFSGSLPIVALAGLYDDYLHLAVPADSPIRTLADLRGHRLGTGGSGLAARILTDRLLYTGAVREVTTVTIPPAELGAALTDRRVDAIAITGGLPTPAVADLARTMPIRLLPIADERDALFRSFPDQYLSRSVPAPTYGLPGGTETVGVRTVLVVRAGLPEEVAHAITQLLFEARPRLAAQHEEAKRLDLRSALDAYPLALHPGAIRYYRESKPMT
jgi:TRAP transporter TAXI family solute receptor